MTLGLVATIAPGVVKRGRGFEGRFRNSGVSVCLESDRAGRGHTRANSKCRAEAESHGFCVSCCCACRTCGTTAEAPGDGAGATSDPPNRACGVAHDNIAGGADQRFCEDARGRHQRHAGA